MQGYNKLLQRETHLADKRERERTQTHTHKIQFIIVRVSAHARVCVCLTSMEIFCAQVFIWVTALCSELCYLEDEDVSIDVLNISVLISELGQMPGIAILQWKPFRVDGSLQLAS
jgi:hypothetical protein